MSDGVSHPGAPVPHRWDDLHWAGVVIGRKRNEVVQNQQGLFCIAKFQSQHWLLVALSVVKVAVARTV